MLPPRKSFVFDGILSNVQPNGPMRHSTYVEVNLSKLARNFSAIQRLAGPHACVLPMVKGNAYGNGILQVSAFLTRDLGVRRLGVATLGEALQILEHMPQFANDPLREIVVFSDTELQNKQLLESYQHQQGRARIYPTLGTKEDLELVLDSRELRDVPLFIKVNTGMNRMGMKPDEILELAPRIRAQRGGRIDHLMQHFAASWLPLQDGDKTVQQYQTFQEVKRQLADSGILIQETSAANSGAIEQRFGVGETHVRPGLMLYGPATVTHPHVVWTGEQVSTLHTKVLRSMVVRRGECVGYGFHPVAEDCVVALLPIGYADGFLRYYSGLGVDVCGMRGTVHGLINMDLTAVVLCPSELNMSVAEIQNRVRAEAPVTVWDKNLTDIADFVKTNPYQLMTGISIRVPRYYTVDP
jgi:alanine racemase